jgi:2-dehydro-3-deoxygluconokinase
MPEVLTLGECMAVMYPHEPIGLDKTPSLAIDIAGAEANLAIGLSRLGHTVQFISRVGADPLGLRIRATLTAEGVDTSNLLTDEAAPTGIFFREWLPDGKRRVFYYRAGSAASCLSPTDLAQVPFAAARILHLTGITPALSQSCTATVQRAIELAHTAGCLVAFDPNYRAPLWDAATARSVLFPLLAQSDIILMGHEDATVLFETEDEKEMLARSSQSGAKVIVLKRAERGAIARMGDLEVEVPADPIEQVVDPVGAGDGFDAGFLSGWLRGYTLEDALRLGARIGALAVAAQGDYAGYPRE